MSQPVRLRISVLALFVDGDEVLLLHQMTPPEPNCWDLPGGGLHPEETLMQGLRREVQEEVGLTDFRVEGLLTLVERFFPDMPDGQTLHALNVIYRCSVVPKPTQLQSQDPEVGPQGIRWLPVADLTRQDCSTRTWEALQAAGLLPSGVDA